MGDTNKMLARLSSLARLTIAAIFIAAAIPKLIDPAAFATAISNYQVFPFVSWNALAVLVPMLELVGAAALLLPHPKNRRAAALLLGGLTLSFIALIASVILRGIDIDCGCFGEASTAEGVGWPLLLRDLVLLLALVLVFVQAGRQERASAPKSPPA